MPARSQLITQADLNALAALATTKLLPVVNANINPADPSSDNTKWHGCWDYRNNWGGFPNTDTAPSSWCDRDAGNYAPLPSGIYGLAYPQPDYSFAALDPSSRDAVFKELNRIYGDALRVIFGNNGAAWTDAAGIFQSPDALVSGPWCVGVNEPATYDLSAGSLGSSLLEKTRQGELAGTVNGMVTFKEVTFYYSPLEVFNDLVVSSGWRLDYSAITEHYYIHDPQGTQALDLDFEFSSDGQFKAYCYWQLSGPGVPAVGDFTLTDTSGLVAWSVRDLGAGKCLLVAAIDTAATSGTGILATLTAAAPAGYAFDTEYYAESEYGIRVQSVSRLIFANATNFRTCPVIHPNGQGAAITADDLPVASGFTLNGNLSESLWVISDATVKGVWAAKTLPVPGMNVFLDQDLPPFVGQYTDLYRVSPGYYDFRVAVGANWNSSTYGYTENPPDGYPSGVGLPYASSMRQFAQMQFGTHDTYVLGYLVSSEPNYNVINEALQPQPTPYLCRRDTDTVPFSLGFNENDVVVKTTTTIPATYAEAYQGGLSVPSGTTGIKIRVVASGTGLKGWRAGQLSYGDPAPDLEIYVSKTGYPDRNDIGSYDFSVAAGNEVNIPNDGGSGYLAGVLNGSLNFAVYNPSGAPVTVDVLIEKDFGTVVRQFFPVCRESFSYCVDGRPGILNLTFTGSINMAGLPGTQNKPVPQSGYCIYKIRASRVPAANAAGIYITPASGPPISVTIGQNVLQSDGSLAFTPFSSPGIGAGNTNAGGGNTNVGAGGFGQDFTIVIPASAGTSGDIDVFWPVLAGNEVVWSSEQDVIFEAWVNWQPLFYNQIYGVGPMDNLDTPATPGWYPQPTAFMNCLSFTNLFEVQNSGYLPLTNPYEPTSPARTKVQFPPCIELYNDLINLLNLL